MRPWIFALLTFLVAAGTVRSATLRVPSEYATIQAGLDAAASGDTVLVAPGTYTDVKIRNFSFPVASAAFLKGGVTLASEAGAVTTTIDVSGAMVPGGGGVVFGLVFASEEEPGHVEGFTFLGGATTEAAVTHEYTPGLSLVDCEFRDLGGLPYSNGGAVRTFQAPLIVQGCSFHNCDAVLGGGAIWSYRGDLSIDGSEFVDCERAVGAVGEAALESSFVEIRDSVFRNNTSAGNGASVSVRDFSGDILITNCWFEGDQGNGGSGASVVVSSDFDHSGAVLLQDSVFLNNRMGTGGTRAGAAQISSRLGVSVVGCTFVGNGMEYAAGPGSSLLLRGAGGTVFSVERCVIAGSIGGLGAVSVSESSTLLSECNVLWQNEGGSGDLITGGTNFEIDPQFCNAEDGDLRLAASSPCLPENNFPECAERIGALGIGCSSTGFIPVGLRSLPGGVLLTADGATVPAPWLLAWAEGTSHEIGAPPSPVLPVPGSRYWFQSWAHGGPENQTVVAAPEYVEYTALFDEEHRLTLEVLEGEGSAGTSDWVPDGESRQILAVPDPGWQFVRWEGSGPGSHTGPSNPAIVTLNNPIVQRAIFETQFLPLTMDVSGGGTAIPETGPQARRTLVPIEAFPDEGWVFLHWVGEGLGAHSGPENPTAVFMHEAIRQTAVFVDADPLLAMDVVGGGWVTPTTGPQDVFSDVEIEATPELGWEFAYWLGTGVGSYSGSNNPATVTMNEPITQTATFVVGELPLTMLAEEGGTVTPESGDVTSFAEIEIEAVPDPGHRFVQWKGEGDGSYTGMDNPATVTLNGPIIQVAHFEPAAYSVTLSLSDTDPHVHTGGPIGLGNLHLWVTCGSTEHGLQSVRLETTGSLQPLAFLPAPGASASGAGTVLAGIDGCPDGPVRLGSFLVNAPGEGSLCLDVAGAVSGLTVTDCQGATYSWPENVGFVGVHTGGGQPCGGGSGCEAIDPFAAPVGAPDIGTPPSATRLAGIFPNPFSGETTVHLDVERLMTVRVSVFDVAGRQIRTLEDRSVPAGRHSVQWDGRDASGRSAAAGIYFVRLHGEGVDETGKVTLLRSRP